MPIDRTANFTRHRQREPRTCAKGSFRTIKRGKTRIVVCCPRGKWSKRSRRCRVGMRAQSILKPR